MGIEDNTNMYFPRPIGTASISMPIPNTAVRAPYSEKGWREMMSSEDAFIDASFLASDETPKTYNISELESQRDTLVSNKSTAENELSSINSGDSAELSGLKSAMDEAFENYQKAMDEDMASNPELASLKQEEESIKTESDENATNIVNKESEISNKDNEISEQKVTVSGFKSELETLQGQLNSIPANSSEEGSEERNSQLESQRAQLRQLISLKQEQVKQAESKLDRLEGEKKTLEMELQELNNKKTELEESETEVQAKIKETASEAVTKAQDKYNSAKEKYESERESLSSAKQSEITNLQTQINILEAQISEARNQEYEKGNWNIDGRDVTRLATQYEGLTNDEMREIFAEQGARFDEGEWCADFVTQMMNITYGQENTPGDFSRTCDLFCSCAEIKRWGDERGLLTTDSSEVKPGDAIIVNTQSGGLHIGMVVSVNADGTINTIEGNTLDDYGFYDDSNPGQVNRRKRTPEEVNTYVKFH